MTTEQMDWLDDERAGRHKPQTNFKVAFGTMVGEGSDSLIERLRKDLADEDARMRAEVLPPAPEGFRWACELRRADDHYVGDVTIRLVYTLEAVR